LLAVADEPRWHTTSLLSACAPNSLEASSLTKTSFKRNMTKSVAMAKRLKGFLVHALFADSENGASGNNTGAWRIIYAVSPGVE
jgi:hypothetical protein